MFGTQTLVVIFLDKAYTDDVDYPILTGIPHSWPHEHHYVTQRIIQDAANILIETSVPLIGGQNNISEIHFDRQIGFSIFLRNGTEIVLGFMIQKADCIDLKK